MSACAGSLIDASRSSLIEVSSQRFGSWFSPKRSGICSWGLFQAAREEFSKHFAGMVPMDRARQDWVYEYAETGSTLAARSLQATRGEFGRQIPLFAGARTFCKSRGSNGPAGWSGPDGHKLSVIGLPQPAARSACFHRHPHWFAALGKDLQTEAIPGTSPRLSVHPFLCRSCAPH
jgi:hypothetical protein